MGLVEIILAVVVLILDLADQAVIREIGSFYFGFSACRGFPRSGLVSSSLLILLLLLLQGSIFPQQKGERTTRKIVAKAKRSDTQSMEGEGKE